jgi:hypothetical protein
MLLSARGLPMKKILVIDDEEWLREMIHLALKQRGFEVIEANNGADGIEKARQELPDLILCDINMEKVDGYLTLASLRNEAPTAAIPVYSDDRPGRQCRHEARHGTGRGRLPGQAVYHRCPVRRRGSSPEKGPNRARRSRAQTGPFAGQHQPHDAARNADAAEWNHFQFASCLPNPPRHFKIVGDH